MNLFDINYLNKISELYTEAFKFKKYKAMPPVLAVFSGLLMIPIYFFSFCVSAVLFILAFIFETNISFIKSVHSILSNEAKTVHPAAQFVIYWVAWPLVFSLYVIEGSLLCAMIPIYAFLSVLVYIWSFGGIKFHMFAKKDDNIAIEAPDRIKVIPLIFVIIGYSLLVFIPAVHGVFHLIELYYDYIEYRFVYDFTQKIYPLYYRMYLIFVTIFPLATVRNKVKDLSCSKEGEC